MRGYRDQLGRFGVVDEPRRAGAAVVAPTNTTPPLITGTAAVGSTLACASGAWTGGPTYKYVWSRDGSAISGVITSTTPSRPSTEGDTLTCVVTASNLAGLDDRRRALMWFRRSGALSVSTKAPTIAGTPKVGSSLTCLSGTWTGNPTYAYSWNRDGIAIAGATSPSYTVQVADATDKLSCTLVATNAIGSATATTAAVSIPAVPPTSTAPPTISGTPKVGSVLTCEDGTWTGTPTYRYAWKRGGTTIAGATGAIYTAETLDANDTLTCTVTATNSAGSTSVTSAAENVPPLPPANTSPPTLSGAAKSGAMLNCKSGTSTRTPTFSYRWSRDGTVITGATSATYTIQPTNAGSTLTCTVIATNASGSASSTTVGMSFRTWPRPAHRRQCSAARRRWGRCCGARAGPGRESRHTAISGS